MIGYPLALLQVCVLVGCYLAGHVVLFGDELPTIAEIMAAAATGGAADTAAATSSEL